MPSDYTDLHNLSSSSFFPDEARVPSERKVGFWKPEIMTNHYGAKSVASSPLEELLLMESQNMEHHTPYQVSNLKVNMGSERHAVMAARESAHSLPATQYDNGLFSSSLSEIFSRNLRLSPSVSVYGHSVNTVDPPCEEEPFESLEEIEAQTIGNLLPNDDDLLSGLTDGVDYLVQPGSGDDMEDTDLFSSVGGMDLGDDTASSGLKLSEYPGGNPKLKHGGSSGSVAGEHPYGEQPSRTLFVRNINSNVEDSELRALFDQYGDIRTLYTSCKHRGFVMISYYDIRSACNAMRALQNKSLRRRKLDIHFSIPKDNPSEKDINQGTLAVCNLDSSFSNKELHRIFGAYGEIKEICETSQKKIIEFYDVRVADVALRALNRSDIAGKQIKVEPIPPEGTRWGAMQQLPAELEHDDFLKLKGVSLNSTGLSGAVPQISSSIVTNGHSVGVIGSPISPFLENSFSHGVSSSVPKILPSRIRADSVGIQSVLPELGHSQGKTKFDFQAMPGSLPEYHDGFPSHTLGPVNTSISSNRNSREINDRGNGNGPSPGHHFMWNGNSVPPQHPGMMWPNSSSYINELRTAPLQRLHELSRAPSHMLNPVVPIAGHHVGSAPAANPSLWDRHHRFFRESPETSAFHPGSFGSLGMSNNSLQPLEFVPHNVYPRGGNCMDTLIPSKNLAAHFHQQRCPLFPGRGQMVPMMNSFDPPNERSRGRRNDTVPNQADNRKQFELDIDRIMRGEDSRTTLMIKNIPNKYTSKMLLAAIDERHKGSYDFIYLPIDFKNKCNVGYAFINMVEPSLVIPFYQAFNGKKWEKFNSEKVASLAYARIQGKAALVAHFQNSSLMNEDKRCRPILFHTDGPNAGDQVAFPMGVNIRPRPSKTVPDTTEDQGSPINLVNGEGFSGSESFSGSAKDWIDPARFCFIP